MSRGDYAEVTRYHLLKLLQRFGTVKQFDFLFHKSGALEGQPRGIQRNKRVTGKTRLECPTLSLGLSLFLFLFLKGFFTPSKRGLRLAECLMDTNGAEKAWQDGKEAEQAIQCLNGKLALSKKLVVRWAHAQVKVLPISLEPSSSTEPAQSNLSVTAKIKAIEAKLKMMAENPDAEYPAAPVYSYFKPPDKKRTTPYSRTAWKSRR
eukprot:bmy_04591T0